MTAVSTGFSAGMQEWRSGPAPDEWDLLQTRYFHRYLVSRGELSRELLAIEAKSKREADLYRHMALLWNHSPRVVSFWSSIIYQGRIERQPERGAIPIVPDEALSDQQVTDLMTAIWTIWQSWNWQHQMILRPKTASAIGDCLTELVDDVGRGWLYPEIVWPGKVKAITLDYVGNVQAYTLEYPVVEVQARGGEKRYTYRKEVDKESFRHFHDDKLVREYENPYGFVPAIWDRHESDGMSVRGSAAIDKSLDQLMQLNSYFSHAIDYSRKAFFAPVIVDGEITPAATVNVEPKADRSGPGGDDGSALARRFRIMQSRGGANSKPVAIHQLSFDIGQAEQLMERTESSILLSHPEATIYDKLAEKSQISGVGVDRLILPIRGPVEEARSSYDWNTIKLLQMTISMGALRYRDGSWAEKRKPRQDVFGAFTPESYVNGATAFTIGGRDIVIPSQAERAELAKVIESLETGWGREFADLSEDDAKRIADEKAANREAMFGGLDTGAFGGRDFGQGSGS